MKALEEILKSPRLSNIVRSGDGLTAMYVTHSFQGSVVCSWGAGWEHISVTPFKRYYVPSWEDMCNLKDVFFKDDEAVIQIHPPKAEYVNNAPNCLHLWRCTYREMILPPSILVGVRKGQTRTDLEREIKEAYAMAGEIY